MLAYPAVAQTSVMQSMPLRSLIGTYGVTGAHSIIVMDAMSGKILEGSNADKSLPPASVAKIATTLYGLYGMGSGHQFQTRLVGTGKVVNGVLQGDLTLVGGSDPTFDTDRLAQLAAGLQARGITSVAGKFQVYSGDLPYQRMIDPDQPDHVGYNATVSGMNLNFNRVFFRWKKVGAGYETSLSAKGRKNNPEVGGIKITPVKRALPVYKYQSENGADRWTVAADKLGRGGSRWLPVRAPANYTGEVLRVLAREKGIQLPPVRTAMASPKGVVLARDRSIELGKITSAMLKYSNNLTAEVVGLTVSKKRGVKTRNLRGSAGAMSSWVNKRYRIKGASFKDHSGLSDTSRVSARDMALIVAREGWDGALRLKLKSVNLRNSDWKKAPISGAKIVAKTGTLNFASGLSGYIECPNGRRLAFAVFTADLRRRAAIPKDQMDRAEGASAWARKSRIFQHQLIRRWVNVYGASS